VEPEMHPGSTLLIAEAPGAQEAEQGRPLVGASGGWLRGRYDELKGQWSGGLLGRAGLKDSEVSKLNVLQCRPPENLFPTDPEAKSYISPGDAKNVVSHCLKAHVWPVIGSREWQRIILLGDKALRAITGKTEGITTWRGSPLPLVDGSRPGETPCIPTFHPSWLARNQSDLPAVISDLKKSTVVPPEYYSTHPGLEEVRAFTATSFAFDIETIPATGEITMVGLSDRAFHALCVPFGGAYVEELKRIFRDATELIGQNCISFDLPHLQEHGVSVGRDVLIWDSMLCHHLLQPDMPHGLAFIGSVFSGKPAWKHLSGDDEALYCCRDVDVTLQAMQQFKPLLKQQGLLELYHKVQVPLARICHLMHTTGIAIDPGRIETVRAKILEEMRDAEAKLPEALRSHAIEVRRRTPAPAGTLGKSGKPVKFILVPATEQVVPWRSPQAVGAYLYGTLKLPPQVHPKTKEISTGKVALDWLWRRAVRGDLRTVDKSPIQPGLAGELAALRQLRVLDEMISTFTKEEMLYVSRVHPHFNIHGTASGRLSSSDPNLQNIPPAARYIYVPSDPSWRLLEVDFSSLENRLTAWFAGDTERLARLSQPGFNEHRWVAGQIFGIPYDEVEKDNSKDAPYGIAKRVGHGSNYGMGPKKIANLFDMDFGAVRDFSAKWKKLFAKTVAWQENCGKLAKEQGFLVNPFGRRRWFYTDSYYTEALSFLPQSTGADICFRSMLGLMFDRLGLDAPTKVARPLATPCRLLLQVHDSLLFEGPSDVLLEAARDIKLVMEQPWPELRNFNIPVEMKLGAPSASWGELEPYDPAK
jgi:uracil-DNA glycosylase family 4